MRRIINLCKDIYNIERFGLYADGVAFFFFTAAVSFFYTNSTTRAGYSRDDQFYAAYPAGTELLCDTGKLYKVALGTCFEVEDWGPVEYCIMAKHFERQGKSPYAYHSVSHKFQTDSGPTSRTRFRKISESCWSSSLSSLSES